MVFYCLGTNYITNWWDESVNYRLLKQIMKFIIFLYNITVLKIDNKQVLISIYITTFQITKFQRDSTKLHPLFLAK